MSTEEHTELDFLDTLDLSDAPQRPPLKCLLLGIGEDDEELLQHLCEVVEARLGEGHGETLFDLGLQDNGESMNFNKDQWDVALDRIRRVSSQVGAEIRILLTKNVDGAEESETKNGKDTSVSGKLLIRQNPETPEDVIETRIAVVGNGKTPSIYYPPRILSRSKLMRAKVPCWVSWSRATSMMDAAKLE